MITGIAASQLAKMGENELYESLGALHKESKINSFRLMSLDKLTGNVSIQKDEDAGRLFFQRLNKQAYDFFCGGCGHGKDQSCLDHLKSALNISNDQSTMISAVAGLLGASLGWSAVIAGIVAAILIKFVLPNAVEELCRVWGENISDVAGISI
ncbi:hypothetical protein Sulku_1095 [Sulfuricurvum kujiense DSM 16994]|uniref:Uncharacterized protein n=1 Tax=Sulfuricurvum kujiense (strain ATCC BAA-921 / DSM 16994 / JCM 11577 / YK-1) TaxID=709032 RepID=E4TWE0_SULKY|nr:hypothetical protein [Sulfuricurvum kujiense]ADR33758.1 hypothetical protein Sulku_1095 [Sulfuricurvum kujiense DSM 16994]